MILLLIVICTFTTFTVEAIPPQPTIQEIKELIIHESIIAYPDNCPCPFNRASDGSECGERSAYTRKGGYEPICYPSDVTNKMIEQYRSTHFNKK